VGNTGRVAVVDGVVGGVDVAVAVVGVQGCVEGVLLGPGAGGGVIPAGAEFDELGGVALDAAQGSYVTINPLQRSAPT